MSRSHAAWAVIGALAAIATATTGCGRPRAEVRRLPAWVFEASRGDRPTAPPPPRLARHRAGVHGRSEAADFVAAALRDTGLRFDTDGSVAALWGYLRTSHAVVAPNAVKRGDILFFDFETPTVTADAGSTDGLTDVPRVNPYPGRCAPPHHVAIAADVDDDGRITFVEARGGRIRRSYVDAAHPQLRRDDGGLIRNSFLRPKRVGDRPDLPIFAGEMLCAIARANP